MSSKIIEQVEQLNKKITQISNKRVEAEAESKMLLRNLKQGIEEYEKKYGVSLKGKNFDEIAKLVMEEYNTVKQAVEEEYALSSKVVDLIEKGNVKEAKALLEKARAENWEDDGEAEKVAEEAETNEQVVEKPVEDVEKVEEKEEQAAEDSEEDDFAEEDEDTDDVEDSEDESEDGLDFEEPVMKEPVKVPEDEEDDDDDMDFGFNFGDEDDKPVKEKKDDPVKKEEQKVSEPVKEKKDDVVSLDNAFSFDDDDDDNGDFMGFGKILSGSKFEV